MMLAMTHDPVPGVPVVVLGLMGAGKTTLATALAERWGRPLRDSDADLLAATGRTAAQLAGTEGAAGLHEREARHLLDALLQTPAPVVAAAASTVQVLACRQALALVRVVWVDVSVEELVRRQSGGQSGGGQSGGGQSGGGHRPRYGPDLRAILERMDLDRRPFFAQLADVVVESALGDATVRVERQLTGLPSLGLDG